jgi:hypothetical protein
MLACRHAACPTRAERTDHRLPSPGPCRKQARRHVLRVIRLRDAHRGDATFSENSCASSSEPIGSPEHSLTVANSRQHGPWRLDRARSWNSLASGALAAVTIAATRSVHRCSRPTAALATPAVSSARRCNAGQSRPRASGRPSEQLSPKPRVQQPLPEGRWSPSWNWWSSRFLRCGCGYSDALRRRLRVSGLI